eukprot:366199-Chlamydomonas_euryale.AAC.17
MGSLMVGAEFQHILRLLNTNVDGKQKIMYALTSIKGIGRRFANICCKKAEVDMNKRAGGCIQVGEWGRVLPTYSTYLYVECKAWPSMWGESRPGHDGQTSTWMYQRSGTSMHVAAAGACHAVVKACHADMLVKCGTESAGSKTWLGGPVCIRSLAQTACTCVCICSIAVANACMLVAAA